MTKLAVVRIRGKVRVNKKIEDTLKYLNLKEKNNCVILDNTPAINGMIKKVKYIVTWGEVNDDTIKMIQERKKNGFYALVPPRGGFERKGIKIAFSLGGCLGYRGDKINNLIKRMV